MLKRLIRWMADTSIAASAISTFQSRNTRMTVLPINTTGPVQSRAVLFCIGLDGQGIWHLLTTMGH